MLPTFKPGQVLYIRPHERAIKPGDVVVFSRGNEYVVHRVIAISQDGISTRGDNNPYDDLWLLTPDQVLGVVEKAENWDKTRAVKGGTPALLKAKARWEFNALYTKSLPWMGAPYRWFKSIGWIHKVWHPQITRIQVHTSEGELIKYVVRGSTVATWYPQQNRFICRKPYDLVITSPADNES
jgi:signal peptidase I